MARLNDTKGIVGIPLYGDCAKVGKAGERDTFRARPDDGAAFTARRVQPGVVQYSYDEEENDLVGHARPHPNAGIESARAALGYLGKKVAPSSTKVGKFRK